MRSDKIRLSAVIAVGFILASRGAAPAQQPAPVAAILDGVTITLADLDRPIGANVTALEERIFQLRQQQLDAQIAEQLLAKEAARRGISVPMLVEREVQSQGVAISDGQIQQFYEVNKARLPALDGGLRERIRGHLSEQAAQARRNALVAQLRGQADITIHLQAPPVFRVTLDLDGAPSQGVANAPVTLVKFEDFHCPFCKESQRTMAELLARYGERLRIVHKDFPIDGLHPQARLAHRAARCAQEQGKFWAYHDAVYAAAPKAAPEDLKSFARQSGVELGGFEACLSSGKSAAAVETDIAAGTKAGVSGTPAFFVNGRMISGAQPLEQFVRIIDEELQQQR